MLWAVSRAPLAKLNVYKRRMGWTFPWASSHGADFNFDFNVSFTEEQQRAGTSNTTTSAAATPWTRRRPGAGRPVRRHLRNRRCHVPARSAGPERVRAARTASSTTPIPLMRAAWTACGACTSGSTAPPRGATRPASGGAATTSTTSGEPGPGCVRLVRSARPGRPSNQVLELTTEGINEYGGSLRSVFQRHAPS